MANLDLPFLFYQKVNVEKDDLEGHTNLAFEATEIETAISKAKDLKTLSKNLDVGDEIDDANDVNDSNDAKKPRVKKTSKKKRFQTETETRKLARPLEPTHPKHAILLCPAPVSVSRLKSRPILQEESKSCPI